MWSLNSDQAGADFVKMYFRENHENKDIIVDDVIVKRVPHQCQNLVLNGDFSKGSSFWSYNDRTYSKVSLVPGAGGGSDMALRSYDRNIPGKASSWRGLLHELDRCFNVGDEFTISAKFKL